jgi:hypothetical protein
MEDRDQKTPDHGAPRRQQEPLIKPRLSKGTPPRPAQSQDRALEMYHRVRKNPHSVYSRSR